MKNVIIKSIILFISIPLINSIAFGIGSLFHDLYQSTISTQQYLEYESAMDFMIIALLVSIPLYESLFAFDIARNNTVILLYIGLFTAILILTWDQFIFRPYEHGLTFLSILSILGTREILNKKLMPTKAKAHG